jgi:hypothetical protein
MEAGKRGLAGDTARSATTDEVKDLRREARDLKEVVAEQTLEDRKPGPRRAWNRVPETIQQQIVDMALEHSELSPRKLAARFTDEKRYFVFEATVYRLLKDP